ncbi:hypothetical protein E4T44_03336 [Aureobasidium sp. EXF-8845]|nr:hypothetical protein E4T44_03336 [Aureobasidium sp. EXF-8845]KAI4855881.1 hypothetical protein E4T45_02668 [Aureobasidium sp. EXF-8846]
MSRLLFLTRLQKTSDGGFIAYPSDQQPTTLLHQHVLDTQDKFVISSFDAHTMNFRITAGKKINHITWKCTPDPNAFKFEFFPNVGRNRTMPTRFHEGQVQVCLNNKWILMVDYLERESKRDKLNPNYLPKFDAQLALKAQRIWWDRNNKVFRLLDLPLELRTEIYRQAAPQDAIEPFARHPKRGILPKNALLPISDRNDMVSNLLRCGGLVGHEMREYVFKNLPLLINHQILLHRTLRRNAWFPRHLLTHLTLALPTHTHYVKLFGLNARNIVTDVEITIEGDEDTAIHLCRDHLPFIKKFEVVIPSREVVDHTYVKHCQTTATTLLLEIMWPFIQAQPVVITGMIKNWQKKWWEAEFAQAHKDFDKIKADTEDGGSRVTQEDIDRAEGKADNNEYDEDGNCCDCIMECCLLHYEEPEPVWEYHLPFFCECDTPCLHGEWTPEDRVKDFEGDAVENSSIQQYVRQ